MQSCYDEKLYTPQGPQDRLDEDFCNKDGHRTEVFVVNFLTFFMDRIQEVHTGIQHMHCKHHRATSYTGRCHCQSA
jgi:hypothetical protein